MAYVGSKLTIVAQSIEGDFQIFSYSTTDNVTAVTANNYFSDGAFRGMNIGDWVFLVAAGYPYMLYIYASNGTACSGETASLSLINGNSLPTVQPAAGSGAIWNNQGFVCVA